MKFIYSLITLLCLNAFAYGADVTGIKVTQMPTAVPLPADLLMVVQSAASKKATIQQVVQSGMGYVANPGTVANTIPVRDSTGALPGNITGDADTVDGMHASAFATAAQGAAAQVAAPTGTVIAFAGAACPMGWLPADGGSSSRTAQAGLFSVIGTTFGAGDGATTFKRPDLRGEFIRGADYGRGVDSGRAVGSAQSDAMQNITGSFGIDDRSISGYTPQGAFFSTSNGDLGSVGSDGGGGGGKIQFDASRVVRTASETRPRNVALLYCIKP